MKKKAVICSAGIALFGLLFACGKGGAAGGPPVLTPDSVTPVRVLTVKQLSGAYFVWQDRTVTLTGFCKGYTDRVKIGMKAELTATPTEYRALASCAMKQDYPEEFPRIEPVVIRGRVKGDSYWGVELVDCELVSRGKSVATTAPVPGAGGVFTVKDFAAALGAWKGREVSVTGYYWGTTTSTTSYGKTVRIDLQDGANGNLKVGCNMKEDHKQIDNRDGVIIRGFIEGETFGRVSLTNCILVNR